MSSNKKCVQKYEADDTTTYNDKYAFIWLGN